MSLLKISQRTGIPNTTLHDYLRGKYVGKDKPKSVRPTLQQLVNHTLLENVGQNYTATIWSVL